MIVRLKRIEENEKQTLGKLVFGDEELELVTLELPDKNNRRGISRIPKGKYNVIPRWSQKYGEHYIVQDVPYRSYILFHHGNYYNETKGCILVGEAFKDINGDGITDIVYSKRAMSRMNKLLGRKSFKLIIE